MPVPFEKTKPRGPWHNPQSDKPYPDTRIVLERIYDAALAEICRQKHEIDKAAYYRLDNIRLKEQLAEALCKK